MGTMKLTPAKDYSSWINRVIEVNKLMDGCKIFMFASLTVFSIMAMTSIIIQKTSFRISLIGDVAESNNKVWTTNNTEPIDQKKIIPAPTHQRKITPEPTNVASQQYLEGLFAPGTDKESCLSRHESSLLRKPSNHTPSPYLISKLRHYESLHRRCGPYTLHYNQTLKLLKSGHNNGTITTPTECNYVVYTALSGLGNRMLTIASTFLYALLANRVLLVQFGTDSSNLFCEPFPNTTWLLPSDFPLNNGFGNINQKHPHTFGNLMKNKMMINTSMVPSYLFLYLAYNIDRFDPLFYCNKNQNYVQNVSWLIIMSNQYFVPALFLMPRFKNELEKMFPNKETVFHNLGHYLFQPSNEAWGLISRFYQAYLAKANQRIGIQVRVLDEKTTQFRAVMDQILDCTIKKKVLPEVGSFLSSVSNNNQSFKAILVTSLYSSYYEYIKEMYWTKPTKNGDMVAVYQPSHEEYEQYGNNVHSMKAWTEMNLLSMSDVLVTSSWSTFGYVAQGLGGLRPWILYRPRNETVPNPSCVQAMSMEPCFHFPPRFGSCKANDRFGEAVVAHVKHCEDVGWGLKLVNVDD